MGSSIILFGVYFGKIFVQHFGVGMQASFSFFGAQEDGFVSGVRRYPSARLDFWTCLLWLKRSGFSQVSVAVGTLQLLWCNGVSSCGAAAGPPPCLPRPSCSLVAWASNWQLVCPTDPKPENVTLPPPPPPPQENQLIPSYIYCYFREDNTSYNCQWSR